MSQHDYVIANGTGAAVRSDLNGALAAIVSNNSGATAPSTTYAYQWWADTTTGLLKIRNAANNAWVTIGSLSTAGFGLLAAGDTLTAALGSASTPGITFTGDLNTGIYSPGADQVAISTNGTGRLFVDSSGRVAVGTSTATTTLSVKAASAGNGIDITHNGGGAESLWKLQSGIVSVADGYFAISQGSTPRITVTNTGAVGIGTTSPGSTLDVAGTIRAGGSGVSPALNPRTTSGNTAIQFSDLTNTKTGYLNYDNNNLIYYADGAVERFRCDSSGRLLVGTSTARSNYPSSITPNFQFENGTGNNQRSFAITHNDGATAGPIVWLAKTRGSTVGSNTLVASGDELGQIVFNGADGTNLIQGASILAQVDGTPGANDMPGRLVFSTTADGASSPTERMRIASDGAVFIAKTGYATGTAGIELQPNGSGYFTRSASLPLLVNRLTDDGTLIAFYQDTTLEGSISVSGTTVSYNGAHLSRYSQLPSGAEREEILRGTVLTNIDEMCEWGEEDNEQLNRMKVSDVEGDKNVSGVFQCWDDDDDTYTNDFYCAMTGDFIIRIGAGVTVERGDLLMSAGDGTAKPQDDDIIRSKTIAKVTSTNVSCTYDDGSYCVPCVLMAC